jgi:hypothetical protein
MALTPEDKKRIQARVKELELSGMGTQDAISKLSLISLDHRLFHRQYQKEARERPHHYKLEQSPLIQIRKHKLSP